MTDTPRLLTIKLAIKQTGLSRSTLYRWLTDGKIVAKKLGRSTLISADSLDAAISALPDYR